MVYLEVQRRQITLLPETELPRNLLTARPIRYSPPVLGESCRGPGPPCSRPRFCVPASGRPYANRIAGGWWTGALFVGVQQNPAALNMLAGQSRQFCLDSGLNGGEQAIAIAWLVLVGIIFIAVLFCWCRRKDYFPLKVRSTYLTLLLLCLLLLFLTLYPTFILLSADGIQPPYLGKLFRALFSAVQCSLIPLYVLRSSRVVCAHSASKASRTSKAFKLFEQEYACILIAGLLFALRAVGAALSPESFLTVVDLRPAPEQLLLHHCAKLLVSAVASYALFLQRSIEPNYGLMSELLPLLVLSVLVDCACFASYIVGFAVSCYRRVPVLFLLEAGLGLAAVGLSFVVPLCKAQKEYPLLSSASISEEHRFVFHNYLMEAKNLEVFVKFLEEYGRNVGLNKGEAEPWRYCVYLSYWMKISQLRTEHKSPQMIEFILSKMIDNETLFPREVSRKSGILGRDRRLPVEQVEQDCLKHLFAIFRDKFKKTDAYLCLRRLVADHERIANNLHVMSMTNEDPRKLNASLLSIESLTLT